MVAHCSARPSPLACSEHPVEELCWGQDRHFGEAFEVSVAGAEDISVGSDCECYEVVASDASRRSTGCEPKTSLSWPPLLPLPADGQRMGTGRQGHNRPPLNLGQPVKLNVASTRSMASKSASVTIWPLMIAIRSGSGL